MTAPLIVSDPQGRYRARVVRLDGDLAPTGLELLARFRSPAVAREWVQHMVLAETVRHGSEQQQWWASVHDGTAALPLYEMSGTGVDLAFRLALLARTGLDEAHVTGYAELPLDEARRMLADYRRVTDALADIPATERSGDRFGELARARSALRGRIHSLALAAAPLSQPAHLLLAQGLLETDTAGLRDGSERLLLATYHILERPMTDENGYAPGELGGHGFAELAQAREWLVSKAAATMLAGDTKAEVRATVFDAVRGAYVLDLSGTPARIGLDFARTDLGLDGVYIAAIPQVDHQMLARLVEAFEQATDFIIDTVNTHGGPSVDLAEQIRFTDAFETRFGIREDLDLRIEGSVVDPEESALAVHRRDVAERRLEANTDHIETTVSDSSGFVKAEIVVALTHLTHLARYSATAGGPSAEDVGYRIQELGNRIDGLANEASMTSFDRMMVAQEVTRITLEPHQRRVGLYPWPSLEALTARTAEVTAAPVRPGHRSFGDALRLHHLTQAIAADTLNRLESGRRREHLTELLTRQRSHLVTSITTEPGLSTHEARGLNTALKYRPLEPIPNLPHEPIAPAHRAENPPGPDPADRSRDYLIGFEDPGHPGRLWCVGVQDGAWIARSQLRYPGYHHLGLPELTVVFDDFAQLSQALPAGLTGTTRSGRHRSLPPVALPETARTALARLHTLRQSTGHPRPGSSQPTTGQTAKPATQPSAPAPATRARAIPRRRPPPPAAKPRRRPRA